MYGVKKQISWILFGIILLTSFSLVFSFNVNAEEETSSIIYIKSDGSVDPSTAPIKVCGNRYYITADITGAIYVEKSGIVIFGRSNELSAPEDDDEDNYGVYIKDQSSVYLFDLEITGFDTYGVYLLNSDNCGIVGNLIHENYVGIRIENSDENRIYLNDIFSNSYKGLYLMNSDFNEIIGNDVMSSTWCIYLHRDCDDNQMYYNSFQKYTIFLDKGANTWDDGCGMGNYWDTYTGLDDGSNSRVASDGVGDTHHTYQTRLSPDRKGIPMIGP